MGADDTTTPFPLLDEILHATARYLGALTVLDEADLAAPSALPGWTRAHVVAHLSRNADAFTRVLDQAAAGEAASMYDAADVRDHDIDRTVEQCRRPDALLRDAEESSRRLERTLRAYAGPWGATYTRVPGEAAAFDVETVAPRRLTEVLVHHADLLVGYRPTAWPPAFSRDLIGRRQDELGVDGPSMVLSATDGSDGGDPATTGGLWKLGSGPGPEITGSLGDLAWWLVGRGGGAGLVSSTGELPTLPRWR